MELTYPIVETFEAHYSTLGMVHLSMEGVLKLVPNRMILYGWKFMWVLIRGFGYLYTNHQINILYFSHTIDSHFCQIAICHLLKATLLLICVDLNFSHTVIGVSFRILAKGVKMRRN